ncbi:hypothetical protein G7066_08710 [Leucobacter coleopterorum]|uniref:RAMA domain-containing protein n=1 Tax=Leucobacter coleopterorum TaxID=2714933 RepID=A0ABX6JWJ0_9MICO|nr:hypothetical protein [Leucobacter coleopterorum]QIM18671.1 hypothetical protein G7066_08710 [Leucobacter coleopterorum]
MSKSESHIEARAELRSELAAIPTRIQAELTYIDEKIADGCNLIVNDGEKTLIVHEVTCTAIARQLDRASAWRWVREEIEIELAKEHFVPHFMNEVPGKMPSFFRREEVERLSEYRACGTCQPMLAQREKKRPRHIPSTRLGSLGEQHVGREFVTAEGYLLGKLRVVRVVAEFEGGTVTSDDDASVSMVPLDIDSGMLQAMIRERAAGRVTRTPR